MKLLLKISFLGTNYNGYQVQPDKPTVQFSLNNAAKRIFGFDCDIVGCSRTDSGVHANEFFACVSRKVRFSPSCTTAPAGSSARRRAAYAMPEIFRTGAGVSEADASNSATRVQYSYPMERYIRARPSFWGRRSVPAYPCARRISSVSAISLRQRPLFR